MCSFLASADRGTSNHVPNLSTEQSPSSRTTGYFLELLDAGSVLCIAMVFFRYIDTYTNIKVFDASLHSSRRAMALVLQNVEAEAFLSLMR